MSTLGYICPLLSGTDARHGRRKTLSIAVLIMTASVAACATQPGQASVSRNSTPNAAASQTAGAAATQAAEPVRVDVTAQQQGALATHAARLTIAVTVTNQTASPIHIYRIPCQGPFFDLELEVNHVAVTGNLDDDDPCLLDTIPVDKEPAIAPGGAHTFTMTVDLKNGTLDPGAYVLVAKVQWHQGSQDALDQLSAGQSDIPHGLAEGTGAVTLQ